MNQSAIRLKPVAIAVALCLPVLSACQNDSTIQSASTPASQSQQQHGDQRAKQANRDIESLASIIATRVLDNNDNVALRSLARSEMAHGRSEILFKDLLNDDNSRQLRSLGLDSVLSKLRSDNDAKGLIKDIPYANLYIHNSDRIDEDQEILVAAAQYNADGSESEFVTAFDRFGNEVQLSNDEEPDMPVIVVGISEYQNMLDSVAEDSRTTDKDSQTRSTNGAINHNERLLGMKIYDDKEPWSKGYPEIYALWAVGENQTKLRQTYGFVNKENTYYAVDSVLFSYADTPETMYYKVEVWENDYNWWADTKIVKGSYKYENKFFGIHGVFSGGASFGDNDDSLGQTQIYFHHPNPVSYSTGDAQLYLAY